MSKYSDDSLFEILMLGYYDNASCFGKSNFPKDIFQVILGELVSLNSSYLKIKADDKADVSTISLSPDKLEELNAFRGDVFELSYFNAKRDSPKTYVIALANDTIDKDTIVLSTSLVDSLKSRMNVSCLSLVRIRYEAEVAYGEKIFVEYTSDDNLSKFESHLKPFFLDTYRPVCVGDCFMIDGISFLISAVEPNGYCIVTPSTLVFDRYGQCHMKLFAF